MPPDATIDTDAGTLAALVYDELELDEALSSGDLGIEGDREAVERFLALFPLPEPAPSGRSSGFRQYADSALHRAARRLTFTRAYCLLGPGSGSTGGSGRTRRDRTSP